MQANQTKFPLFEANQVLTNAHLNQLFAYLDEQQRLSRAYLTGIGPVCGLQVSIDGTTVKIGKGLGISSDGYLLFENQLRSLSQSRQLTPLTAAIDDLQYSPFRTASVQWPLWELLPAEASGPGVGANTVALFADKAVVAWLELKQTSNQNCTPNNCDDKGCSIEARMRYFLVPLTNLASFAPKQLPEVPLARIHFATANDLLNYQTLYRNFFTTAVNGKTPVQRLLEAVNLAFTALAAELPGLSIEPLPQLASRFNFPAGDVPGIQYYYDWLRDLTAAYHELRAAYLRDSSECLPSGNFPQHLLLGAAVPVGKPSYRQPLIAAQTLTLGNSRREQLRFLFERLKQMVQQFNPVVSNSSAIKITPSRFGQQTLVGKALPFYYQSGLRGHWDVTRSGELANTITSWHSYADSPAHIVEALDYDLEPYNFFRFEGHISVSLLNTSNVLRQRLTRYRLPMSILYLNSNDVGDFLERHPGLEHQAGCLNNGTLVLIYRDTAPNPNTVLADFSLPYRIEHIEDTYIGRVKVQESLYPWIDSKLHLANLSQRSYQSSPGSQEQQAAKLDSYYVIVVHKYEIQGQSILPAGPREVLIPRSEVASGQLSSIARYLNLAFPTGLIFDYQRNGDQLIIRYFSDQTFRIEWSGLQGHQIRYAYTENAIYRWQNQQWQSMSGDSSYLVNSQERDEYLASEYRWLQNSINYRAKYPAANVLATADELIRWENTIKVRARSQTPLPIAARLRNMAKLLNETHNVGAPMVNFSLIGAWANGSWVSQLAVENNFPITDFLDLRRKVTGKTGVSPIELLIELTPDQNGNITITAEQLLDQLRPLVGGYKVELIFGKKGAQKGKGF